MLSSFIQLAALGVALISGAAAIVSLLVILFAFALGLDPPAWTVDGVLWGICVAAGSYAVGWVAAWLED